MANLREKFKATPTAKLKSKIQDEDTIIGSGGRAGFLDIVDGKNKFRIFPAHEGSDDWYVMIVKHWITIEKDGKEARRTVYNARIHGGFKKDVFEEYMAGAKKHLLDSEDEDATDKISTMTDSYKGGLVGTSNWLFYANKITGETKKFGLVEANKSTRDGLNKIACFEDDDEAIAVDPFTDPDDGIPVYVDYNPKAKKAGDKYVVTTGNKPKAMPLTDDELEEFDKQKPLAQLANINYGLDDLTLALEGIRFFDEKFDINYWDTDDWQEKIEEITAMVKGGKSKKSTSKSTNDSEKKIAVSVTKKKIAPVKDEDEEEETEEEEQEEEAPKKAVKKKGDKFTEMDRDELKEFIAEEELPDKAGLKVMKSDSDDDIRNKIRAALASLEEETEEEEQEEEVEEEEEAPAKKKSNIFAKKLAAAKPIEDDDDDEPEISLEDIKKKIKANKGK